MKNMMRTMIVIAALSALLVGCAGLDRENQSTRPFGMGRGMAGGMMERHHAQVPSEYAGLTNPVPAGPDSLNNGAALYATHCASCHGDGGMGDGPAGTALDPAPAAVAHTSQEIGDAYLFWRISEGGGTFNTAMPAWKDSLDETSRWDLINYMRALGKGDVEPQTSFGGARYDPTVQATHQADILAQAVQQKIVTQAEADTFEKVHAAIEEYRTSRPEFLNSSASPTEQQATILDALVKDQRITQAEADTFPQVHDRLGASGLMP